MRSMSVMVLALAVLLGACDDDPVTPNGGTLQVQVTKSGAGTDANGFKVSVDDGAKTKNVTVADTVDFELEAGSHKVALTDVSSNCTVGGTNPRTVTIQKAKTETVAFAVTCTAN